MGGCRFAAEAERLIISAFQDRNHSSVYLELELSYGRGSIGDPLNKRSMEQVAGKIGIITGQRAMS
jgi:hypothetical protein